MSTRIDSRISAGLDTSTTLQTPGATRHVPRLGEQIQISLFRAPRPALLDPAAHPHLAAWLRAMGRFRRKLAALAGDQDDDYEVRLASGNNAAIDEHGTIYFGAGLGEAFEDMPPVWVGILAHEIGHRPKRWKEGRYQIPRELSYQELQALCRLEETRADAFAGKALAELGMSCEPLVEFLIKTQTRPHPEYLPAEDRARVIRESHSGRAYRIANRRKLFPHLDILSAKNYLGEF